MEYSVFDANVECEVIYPEGILPTVNSLIAV